MIEREACLLLRNRSLALQHHCNTRGASARATGLPRERVVHVIERLRVANRQGGARLLAHLLSLAPELCSARPVDNVVLRLDLVFCRGGQRDRVAQIAQVGVPVAVADLEPSQHDLELGHKRRCRARSVQIEQLAVRAE